MIVPALKLYGWTTYLVEVQSLRRHNIVAMRYRADCREIDCTQWALMNAQVKHLLVNLSVCI